MKKQFNLAPIFKDNMVFQSNKPIRIFGTCKKGIEITISFLNQETTFRTKSKEFLVELHPEGLQEKGFSFKVYTKKQIETVYNCLIGEVFFIAGSKNVSMSLKDSYYEDDMENFNVRFINLREGLDENLEFSNEVTWNVCGKANLENISALSYLTAKHISERIHVPIGIIVVDYHATTIFSWMSVQDSSTHLNISEYIQSLPESESKALHVNLMYEQLIKQVVPFSFKMVIFYQGENDYEHYHLFDIALIRIIKSFRMTFKDSELPVIITQIAGYSYPNIEEENINQIRYAQGSVMDESRKIFVVSAVDLGDEDTDIPKEKLILSRRIANVVLEKFYSIGKNSISPTYYSYQKQHDGIVIHTKNNYLNLTSHSRQNLGFTYTKNGVDFIVAKNIEIMNGRIMIKDVSDIKEIRYAYKSFPFCDIYTTNELPLLPFRIKFKD